MGESRLEFFERNRRELAAYYLADPGTPYQQSGRSSGPVRWEETRRPIADCVHRGGSFLDVGCANGLLLETVGEWLGERGLTLELCGVDFIAELVALAQERLPDGQFWVANAWDWVPPRPFTFVRTNLEYVPLRDRREFVSRQLDWVEPGGRLIVCYYRDRGAPAVDVAHFLSSMGLEVGGIASVADPPVAWVDVAASTHRG